MIEMVQKVELMHVQGKLTLTAPKEAALGEQIGLSGEFRVGVTPTTGAMIYIYEGGPPERLIGYSKVDFRGRYHDYWVPPSPGRYIFFSRCFSPTNQSPNVSVEVTTPTKNPGYLFPGIGQILARWRTPSVKTVGPISPIKPVKRSISKPSKIYV